MRIERMIDLADPVKEPELPAHIRAGASLWALPRFDKARRYEQRETHAQSARISADALCWRRPAGRLASGDLRRMLSAGTQWRESFD